MAKTPMLEGVTGEITPGAGNNSFEITDLTELKTLVVEGLGPDDALNVVRENYAGDDWEPYTDNGKQVQLNSTNRSATVFEFGVFSVEGELDGTITLYTLDAS